MCSWLELCSDIHRHILSNYRFLTDKLLLGFNSSCYELVQKEIARLSLQHCAVYACVHVRKRAFIYLKVSTKSFTLQADWHQLSTEVKNFQLFLLHRDWIICRRLSCNERVHVSNQFLRAFSPWFVNEMWKRESFAEWRLKINNFITSRFHGFHVETVIKLQSN